mmetsp:Transcript_36812/g.105800  ORF Transcript_36812/g.105800 Transcript_36812/m.105800 type:complete len:213 (-) Transcript_36812:13-651(-)
MSLGLEAACSFPAAPALLSLLPLCLGTTCSFSCGPRPHIEPTTSAEACKGTAKASCATSVLKLCTREASCGPKMASPAAHVEACSAMATSRCRGGWTSECNCKPKLMGGAARLSAEDRRGTTIVPLPAPRRRLPTAPLPRGLTTVLSCGPKPMPWRGPPTAAKPTEKASSAAGRGTSAKAVERSSNNAGPTWRGTPIDKVKFWYRMSATTVV